MAKANSTRSTSSTSAPKVETPTPGINLSAINPLLITGHGSLESTAINVSAVLSFLSMTIGSLDKWYGRLPPRALNTTYPWRRSSLVIEGPPAPGAMDKSAVVDG